MRHSEGSDDAEDFKKCPAESCDGLPSSAAELDHRRQQQRAQEQNVVKTGPNVPDAGLEKIKELACEAHRRTLELPDFVVWAKYRRMGTILVFQAEQSPMLRI